MEKYLLLAFQSNIFNMKITSNLNKVTREKASPKLTDAQKQELDNRINDHDINPDNTMTWEEIKASIKK
jgi:putative addiction module component (TIGR02574 family)